MSAYFSPGWIVFYIFAGIYLWGWIAMAHTVELEHAEDQFWRKVGSYVILFFIWWYIAICMAGQGDV